MAGATKDLAVDTDLSTESVAVVGHIAAVGTPDL